MERCRNIVHHDKTILLLDYEGLRGEELLNTIKTATQHMLDAQPGKLLVLANFTNTYLNDEIMGYLTGTESKTASKNAKKLAVVGMTGIKKLFLNVYNSISTTQAKTCTTIEAAKDYLVTE